MKRLFLRFFARKEAGLTYTDMNSTQLANWLTELGYDTKATSVRNAKRSKLVKHAVPVTGLTIKLLKLLLKQFPDFKYEEIFQVGSLHEISSKLIS